MDISSLLSSLSAEDIEKLKMTAQQFFGSSVNQNDNSDNIVTQNEKKSNSKTEVFNFNPKMLTGVAKLSEMMNENDEKSAFLYALKPLLSENRRKKVDEAVMMLKLMKIINTLQEKGL